jgi:hypothetical protein
MCPLAARASQRQDQQFKPVERKTPNFAKATLEDDLLGDFVSDSNRKKVHRMHDRTASQQGRRCVPVEHRGKGGAGAWATRRPRSMLETLLELLGAGNYSGTASLASSATVASGSTGSGSSSDSSSMLFRGMLGLVKRAPPSAEQTYGPLGRAAPPTKGKDKDKDKGKGKGKETPTRAPASPKGAVGSPSRPVSPLSARSPVGRQARRTSAAALSSDDMSVASVMSVSSIGSQDQSVRTALASSKRLRDSLHKAANSVLVATGVAPGEDETPVKRLDVIYRRAFAYANPEDPFPDDLVSEGLVYRTISFLRSAGWTHVQGVGHHAVLTSAPSSVSHVQRGTGRRGVGP